MTTFLRPAAFLLFSVLVIAVSVGTTTGAGASPSTSHSATVETNLARIGFLDLKTFMVVPEDEDGELGLASEQMRVISPETLWSRQSRMDLLKSFRENDPAGLPAPSGQSIQSDDFDSMPIKVNGQPFTLSLGLREAIIEDMEFNIRTYGDPGFFNGIGFASAAYLGAMTRDVLDRMDTLDTMATGASATVPSSAFAGPLAQTGPTYVIPTPSSMGVFVAGLLMIGWLHRRRLSGATKKF